MYLEEMLPEEMDELHFDQLLALGRFSEYDEEEDDVEWEDSEEDDEESERDVVDEIDLEEDYEFLYDDDD